MKINLKHYVKKLTITANPKWAFNTELKQWFTERAIGRCVHVCCGKTHFPFAINIDIDVNSNADIIADMFHMPFRSNIFDTLICDPPYRLAIHKRAKWVFEIKRVVRKRLGSRILLKTDFIPFFDGTWTLREVEIYTGKRWWTPVSLLLFYEKKQPSLDSYVV